MIIEYEGQRYPFEFSGIDVQQAIKIEERTGLTVTEWISKLGDGPSAVHIQALGWLLLSGDLDKPIEDCNFKMLKLGEAFGKAAEEEAAAEKAREAAEAAGPTVPAAPQNGSGGGSIPALSLPSSPTG